MPILVTEGSIKKYSVFYGGITSYNPIWNLIPASKKRKREPLLLEILMFSDIL